MSENMSNLNDFLEMEENESFADFPFGAPAPNPQTAVQTNDTQSPVPVQQAPQPLEPTQQAVAAQPSVSLFEAAVAETPIAAQTPVAEVPVVSAPIVSVPPTNPPANAPLQQAIAEAGDPFNAALASAKAQAENRIIEAFASREAVFSYGKAKEPITDREFTFEDLREKYESDFPELAESKKVEWTVTYGTIYFVPNEYINDSAAEIIRSGIQNMQFVDFYRQYADEDSEESREEVAHDSSSEPDKLFFKLEEAETVMTVFEKLNYHERAMISAHLGFCMECYATHFYDKDDLDEDGKPTQKPIPE